MKLGRSAVTLVLVGATVALVQGSASAATRVSSRYLGAGTEETYPVCSVSKDGYGGACFLAPAGAKTLRVSILDQTEATVAGSVEFVIDSYGPTVRTAAFCRVAAGIPVPAGTQGVIVRVLATESLQCDGGGSPTEGEIRGVFDR